MTETTTPTTVEEAIAYIHPDVPRHLDETKPEDVAYALADLIDHLDVYYENTGGNVMAIVANHKDADPTHPTDYLTEIIVGTAEGTFGFSDGDGSRHGDIDLDGYPLNQTDLDRFQNNAPLGRDLFRILVTQLHALYTDILTPRPANEYNGIVITDLTVDESGRFPVDPTYYPRRVRDAVKAKTETTYPLPYDQCKADPAHDTRAVTVCDRCWEAGRN